MALFEQLKSVLPGRSDDEITGVINDIRAEDPTAPDDEIVKAVAEQAPIVKNRAVATDYVSNKYGIGQRKQLEDQIAAENEGPNFRAALTAFGTGLTGGNAAAAGQGVINAQRQDQMARLGAFDQNAEREKIDSLAREENDPNSDASKLAQKLAIEMGVDPSVAGKLTAGRFKQLSPTLEKKFSIEQSKLARAEEGKTRALIASEAAATRAAAAEEKLTEKKERQTEQDVQKLSKDIAGVQGLQSSLDDVEAALGAPLDDFSISGGKLTKGGKAVDLPGVSIPLLGRVSAYDTEARGLQNAADKVFNSVLKDRSGAAVTNPELERLKAEFSSGKFNTEPEMVAALQRFKNATYKELKNREAGYSPDVVATYADRGGRTSQSSPNTFAALPTSPKVGDTEDGYRFKGGDPKDPANWEEVGNSQLARGK